MCVILIAITLVVHWASQTTQTENTGKNEPQPVSVYGSSDGDGFMMLWLGCRCSWPVTQLMWWQALGCQLHAWAAVVVAVLTLILQIMILDGFLSQMVGQASHPPGTTASLPKRSAC